MSSTASRSFTDRAASRGLALLAIGLGLTLCGVANAQVADDTKLITTMPMLRGPVGDAGDAPAPLPNGAGASGIGGAIAPGTAQGSDGTTADGQPTDNGTVKFPFPKGTAKTRDRLKPPRKGPPPLPVLQPYPTSIRPRGGGATIDTIDTQVTAAPPTVAALPVPTRLRTKLDENPYDPVGIDVGSLRLNPYVAQSFGYDSNPDQIESGKKPSAYSRTEGGLGVISQWSSNELKADLRGGYNDYFRDHGADRPDAVGTIDFKADINRTTVIDAEQRFNIDTQRPGSPEVSITAIGRPLITTFGETLGGVENFGRLTIGLHGSFDRTMYENAALSDGTIEDLANGNFDDYGLRLRAAYEVSPVFKPFVDVLVDQRVHDATIDLSGFARDSHGVIGQGGAIFEFNHLLTGEISGGYGNRSFQDLRLKDINGPVVNGALSYAVTPLTTINLRAATTFDETTVAGASGTQSRSATLEVAHQLLRNTTLTGSLSYLNTQYIGVPITENTWSETLKAEYHLSRSLVATATYNHERLNSTSAGSSFSQDVFLLGLRLQR